ncbi:MAG: SusC/RagA family TonB-linked outer membrane protein [Cytophagales bacterium]|jgi:TonB-linked SusC/RagA family outer membrane protein|nr:SusC/RagA family TonB-linked outer membrane protein [Cytophagales bacterium]MCA6387627.1 SusC/RagA family TonB-linked outer membrane protein [Cytophagales bacterium]MCA6392090.1 SusC/RagA family TonB-linked outer membrane protein [Cytophagales bacterium]MCA6393789.1 SusC/RagA family TonB-linked outer membrane protein [Cytophagales bacterium]MCA6399651.1 SusC/RagA family TonB-linked outer membrane protein [Cytophagales bacterium]
MRKNLLLKLLPLLFLLATSMAWAQERSVSGKVTSAEDGSGLPGVNVVVKGTTNGTVTDAEGNYRINVPSTGGSLVFSFIGLATSEVAIGERTTIDVSLSLDVQQLSEVVVTGQGIAREKKALGYAVAGVSKDAIEARPVNDIGRILIGKIAGVSINPTGGTAGTGSAINIRGYSTITGNTQPLWVVDGVPFSGATNDASGFTTGGTASATSRFLDLDPNAIESVNVLKGLAATVLYGDQGRSGVILVTTKAGSKKKRVPEVSFQQTVGLNEIASLPELQQNYGNGFQQLTNTTQFFSNYGANYNEIDSIAHPYQFIGDLTRRDPFLNQFAYKRIPYRYSLNLNDFFRRGITSNTSVSISGGTDKMGVTATVGYTKEQGYAPGNDLKKANVSIGFNASLSDKLSVNSSFMYSNTDFATPPLNGATGGGAAFGGVPSLYANFLYSPPNYDINDSKLFPFETPLEQKQIWYRSGSDIPNARWIAAHTLETDVTDRLFNSTTLNYDLNENMSISYRAGLDHYTQRQNRSFSKGIGAGGTNQNLDNGILQTQTLSNTIWNHDLIFAFNKKISSDFNLNSRFGLNARNDFFTRDGLYSEGQIVFGLERHSNFVTASSRSVAFGGRVFQRTEESQRYGAYADINVDYKGFIFLNVSGRNDWVSFLEGANNSLFYPSASTSVVLTDAFPSLKSKTLDFLKLRMGYGTSAGYPSPYNTRTIINANARGFVNAGGLAVGEQTVSNQLGNPKLRGELISEIEAGFETKLFRDRLGIDFTIYQRSTTDLITDAQVDPSTGYGNTFLNLGELRNRGIELGVTAAPLKLANGLRWDVIWNFTLVRPEVITLGQGISQIPLAGFTDLGNFAKPGRPMNMIIGTRIARDPNGNRIVGSDGFHEIDPIIGELGNPNPDYLTTLINTISFKGFSLSFQFDYRKGGMMFASTPSALLARGVLGSSAVNNRDLAYIAPGVKRVDLDGDGQLNGSADGFAPNDVMLTATDFGFNLQFGGRNDNNMFDATNIRLREVGLSYVFPRSLLAKTPIKGASITLNGNNLWYFAFGAPSYTKWDPEVSSTGVNSGLGFDYLTGPSMRRYGAVLKLTF